MAKDLSSIIAKLPKELREAVRITNMADIVDPYDERLPFGVMSMDRALKGGIPGGVMAQVFGPDGVGKDYLSQLAMASCQRTYGEESNIFYVTFGYYPDREFMRFSGVQLPYSDKELIKRGIDPENATEEERGTCVGNVLFIDVNDMGRDKPAEYLLDTALRFAKSGEFQLGIINELASGETEDNTKKALYETAKMATWATLMSDFCRKFYTTVRSYSKPNGGPNDTRILLLNPVRDNLDAHSAKYIKYVQPGGRAQKHAKVIDIHLDNRGKIRKNSQQVGKTVKWRIAKAKLGLHEGAEGEWDFYFDGGIDRLKDLYNVAKVVGTVYNVGRYYYVLTDPEKISGGGDAVEAMLKEDPELAKQVEEATLDVIRGKRKINRDPDTKKMVSIE